MSSALLRTRFEVIPGKMDEKAYRGGNHPPYCTCHRCSTDRAQRSQQPSGAQGIVDRLLRLLRLRK